MLVVKKCQIKNTQYKDKDNGNCNKHNFDLFKSSLPIKLLYRDWNDVFLFKDYKLGHKLLYNVYIEPILLGALGAWIGAINKNKGFVNVLNLITKIKKNSLTPYKLTN